MECILHSEGQVPAAVHQIINCIKLFSPSRIASCMSQRSINIINLIVLIKQY